MRTLSLTPVLPFVLLGCTFNSYPAHTLPPAGFGMQSAPAAQSASGWGGQVEVTRPSSAQKPRQVRVVGNEARATRPSTPKAVHKASADAATEQASATQSKPSSASPSASASTAPAAAASGSTARLADAAGPAKPASPSKAQKPAPRAQPTRRTVMLARGSASGTSKSAHDARLRQSSAGGQRGTKTATRTQGTKSERDASAAARALSAMKDRDSSADGRMQLREEDAQGDSHDASGTAQLAQGERTEHVHRADEREKLAAK